jgi:hypothetical protein
MFLQRGAGISLITIGDAQEAGHLVREDIDDGHQGENEHQELHAL